MNINVQPEARDHFWEQEPVGTTHEFWSFRFKPPCKQGDDLFFRFNGIAVAKAICDYIEPPGQSVCSTTGKFLRGWKVFWKCETFKDLRYGEEK